MFVLLNFNTDNSNLVQSWEVRKYNIYADSIRFGVTERLVTFAAGRDYFPGKSH